MKSEHLKTSSLKSRRNNKITRDEESVQAKILHGSTIDREKCFIGNDVNCKKLKKKQTHKQKNKLTQM